MPAGFGFPDTDVRFWLPLAITSQALAARGVHQFSVVGRLRSDVTLAAADRELAAVTQRVTTDPAFNFHDWHPAFLRPLRTQIVGDVSQALWMMLAAVGVVLAIACANVANLLLVRSEDRAQEMAVRTALGASRGRVLSHLLAESLVMTTAGALAGVALAYVGVDVLRAVAPAELPRLDEISVDGVALAFTALLTLSAALLFGALPAVHVGRTNLQGTLREGSASTTADRARTRLRQTLVVSETALAVVLLISAGLLLQSYRRLSAVDPGYSTEQVLTARLDFPDARYTEPEDAVAFYESLLTRVRSLPGVTAAGAIRRAPLSIPIGPSSIEVEGWVEPADASPPAAVIQLATPGYFEAMGIPVLEGRAFDTGDRAGSTPVAVVTESLARSYWPGRGALGGRLRVDDPDLSFVEIVGVVPDVRQNRLDQPPEWGTMFVPHAQAPSLSMTLTVRSGVESASLVSAIRTEVGAMDSTIPVHDVRTIEQALADTTASQRYTALLQLLFALVALSLSAVGLYGVLAFTVTRRTNEIGIRIALGPERDRVRRMVVRQGMGLVAVAIALGLVGALTVARLLEGFLYGTSAVDPLTYGLVLGTLVAVGLLACWIPARRASSIDPIRALRAD
jgi:putative ABC transport system permease protein